MIAMIIVGVFSGWIRLNNQGTFTVDHGRVLLAVGAIVWVGCEVGFPFVNASQANSVTKHANMRAQMLRDLKREHFRVTSLDEYDKTVTLALGNHGCRVTFGLAKADARGWNDFRRLWRPTLMGLTQGNIQPHGQRTLSVITNRDLWSLANGSCSS